MASRFGPGALQRSNRPTGWEQALNSFQSAFAASEQQEAARQRDEAEYARGAPERTRQSELHEANLFRAGIRRGRAPVQEQEQEPPEDEIGFGVDDFMQSDPEQDPLAIGLSAARMAPPKRPKVVAPPGAFVPGLGFAREPVTEEDLERRDAAQQAPLPGPAGPSAPDIGVRAPQDFGMRKPAPPPVGPGRRAPAPEQISEGLYYDPSLSPEGRARSDLEGKAGALSAGLGALTGLSPEMVKGLRQYIAAGGDPGDYLTYKRGIDTDRTTAPPRVQSSTGEILERGPDGNWVPAVGPGGKPFKGRESIAIIQGEEGDVFRVPRQGPTGQIPGIQGKRTAAEQTREQKIQENREFIAQLEDLIDQVETHSDSFGLQNVVGKIPIVGTPLKNKMDPAGVAVKAKLNGLLAKQFHDLYAGNLTPNELMRAEGWAPSENEQAPDVVKKLELLIERVNSATKALVKAR